MPSRVSKPSPDKSQASALRERLRGLTPPQAEMMRQVMRLHAAGDRLMSTQWLLQAASEAPGHPEVQLWQGLRYMEQQDWPAAARQLALAAAQRPDDFTLWCMLGSAQGHADDAPAALASLRQAALRARNADDWLKLSIECDLHGFYDEALQAADAVLQLQPQSATALLQRVRCTKALGQTQQAAADCRTIIHMQQASSRDVAAAWFSLVDLKTVALDADELQLLQQTADRGNLPADQQQLLDFALGKALEDAGQLAPALAVFQRANANVRAGTPWDGAAFAQHQDKLRAVFGQGTPVQAQPQGGEVVFLVGLPRSGSTLIEQVLASHSRVEGASELPYLNQVLDAESRRRGKPLVDWAAQASADDWTRLGQHYLVLSARWRQQRPVATDKLPDNWLLVGAIRAMLPQARVIDCRREPLETCWSCFKQLFGPGLATFSYGFDSLAQYAKACDSLGDLWAALHPQHVRIQRYEALVQDPETQIRALLDFCGLPFEERCLSFQTAQRAIRTPSALQVRQPMRQTSTPAARMGALLDPLRQALNA